MFSEHKTLLARGLKCTFSPYFTFGTFLAFFDLAFKKNFFSSRSFCNFEAQGSLLPACMTIARSHKAPPRVVLLAIQTVPVLVANVCNKDIVDLSGNKVECFNILTSQSFVS